MYSIFIKNGLIADGTGAKAYPANLGITGDKISYIGTEVFDAEYTIDAAGKWVTPGFIDVHSHGDLTVGSEFCALAKLSQGVTTELIGQCGMSLIPVSGKFKDMVIGMYKTTLPANAQKHIEEFTSLKGFADYAEEDGIFMNAAMFIGHSTLRMVVMGMDNRLATEEEMEEMYAEAQERGLA